MIEGKYAQLSARRAIVILNRLKRIQDPVLTTSSRETRLTQLPP